MAEATKETSNPVKKKGSELVKKEAAKKDVAKANRLEDLKKFFTGTRSELKKVHWPDRQQVMAYTGVVVVAVVIMAGIIWVADLGLGYILEKIITK